jgi:hypothetical protein
MPEKRPTNSELRLRRLTAPEPDADAERGILEVFDEQDETSDEDAALARDNGDDD